MRTVQQVLSIVLIAILALVLFATYSVDANKKGIEPYSPCGPLKKTICANQNGNLCCKWKPPGSHFYAQQCYSTHAYTCLKDNASDAACLCPTGYHCCNLACYRPDKYTCTSNTYKSPGAHAYQLCPYGYKACNGACYLPGQYTCCSGGYLSNTGC